MYFQSVAPSIQPAEGPSILACRSPQLTNGHGYGGTDEHEWTEGMPLGDIFATIMRKAWDIQEAKRRESMNPKWVFPDIAFCFLASDALVRGSNGLPILCVRCLLDDAAICDTGVMSLCG